MWNKEDTCKWEDWEDNYQDLMDESPACAVAFLMCLQHIAQQSAVLVRESDLLMVDDYIKF